MAEDTAKTVQIPLFLSKEDRRFWKQSVLDRDTSMQKDFEAMFKVFKAKQSKGK